MSGGYLYTDRRRVASVPELDVQDQALAQDLAQRPVADIDPTTDALVPDPAHKDIEFNIKSLQLHFGEFMRHHAVARDSTSWTKTFKSLVPGVVGDASLLVMGDVPVATFRRNGQLAEEKLKKEQPQIIAKYTTMRWVPVFDRERFAKEEPDLYRAYRARPFRLVRSGPGAGMILPTAP